MYQEHHPVLDLAIHILWQIVCTASVGKTVQGLASCPASYNIHCARLIQVKCKRGGGLEGRGVWKHIFDNKNVQICFILNFKSIFML